MLIRLLSLLALALPLCAQDEAKLAPYVPTPASVVERMLRLAELQPDEPMMDIGSGDGRIVLAAAGRFQADASGVEIDAELVRRSRELIHTAGLDRRAHIIAGDALAQDYARYRVLTIYLLPSSNDRLRPLLDRQLQPGTRVVAHDFPVPGWAPERELYIEDDGAGRSHTLYLYRIHETRK
jgi:protein-L-isoaspartate O-methyltransferase